MDANVCLVQVSSYPLTDIAIVVDLMRLALQETIQDREDGRRCKIAKSGR